jgi:hypothetical protein
VSEEKSRKSLDEIVSEVGYTPTGDLFRSGILKAMKRQSERELEYMRSLGPRGQYMATVMEKVLPGVIALEVVFLPVVILCSTLIILRIRKRYLKLLEIRRKLFMQWRSEVFGR